MSCTTVAVDLSDGGVGSFPIAAVHDLVADFVLARQIIDVSEHLLECLQEFPRRFAGLLRLEVDQAGLGAVLIAGDIDQGG